MRTFADYGLNWNFYMARYPSVANAEGFNLVLFAPSGSWQDIAEVGTINEFQPQGSFSGR